MSAHLSLRSQLSRKVAGTEVREQVVAANMDVILLVMGLDQDYNLNRLERFSEMAWESGGEPVVVLTKADLDADVGEALRAAEERLPGIPVLALSALHQQCRFADCGHHGEPGCAVRAALREGRLAEARLESYFKLEKEVHALELRQGVVARRKAERGFGLMSRQAQQAKKLRW